MSDKVFVGFVHDNEVTYSWHFSFLEMVGHDMAHSQRVVNGGWFGMRCGTDGVAGARNKVVREFLRTDADWLLWVDTDMGYQPGGVDQLVAAADRDTRPIVGGLCFAMRGDRLDGYGGNVTRPVPVIYDWRRDDQTGEQGFVPRYDYPRDAVVQCSATGSAFVLIHRTVFEKVAAQFMPVCWYDRHQLRPGSVDQDAVVIAEDLSFCMRAAAAGCPTFVHTGVKTTHMKPVWLGEPMYLAASWPEPATDPVAVIVPVLGRPHAAQPFMESLRASTGLATVYAVCEWTDVETSSAWHAAGAQTILGDAHTFAEKANAGYQATTEPWILLVGDDVCFRPGWYDRALRAAGDRFHLVGTNDLSNLDRPHLAVHPLIRRTWVDEHGASWDGPGSIAHEGYLHCFVDNEWSTVAAQAGVFIQAPDAVVEHLHPLFRKADADKVYELGQQSYARDQALWEQRRDAHAKPRGFSIAGSVAAYDRQWHTIPGLVKVQEDLDRYEAILEATRPEVIVETGTWLGVSAAWFANHDIDVITIDVDDNRTVKHDRVTYLHGSSTDPAIVTQVRDLTAGRRTMVILDSDHSAAHVAAELEAYSPLVTPGCYLVVEDTICRWVPDTPVTDIGPLDAVETFLPRPGWEHDQLLLDLHPVSHHPGGWLRRVA